MPNTLTRDIPRSATRFEAGPFRFAAAEADKAEGVPVQMRLRGLDAINHWYWGRIVHDMAGLSIHKDRLPIDYCHDPEQILGYLDKFETTDGLDVSGRILPEDDPRADEIHRKATRGVPYESSMDWADPETELEWIPEGVTTAVNGRTFAGPGYVVRKWSLRGAAICPYGADKHATTNFSAGETVGLTLYSKGDLPPMAKAIATDQAGKERRTLTTISPAQDTAEDQAATPSETPAEPVAETPAETPSEPVAETPAETPAEPTAQDLRRAEAQRFRAAYGQDLGAQLYADGLSFEDAGQAALKHYRDELAKKDEAIAQKDAQIKALRDGLGLADPVSMTPEGAAPAADKQPAQDDNLERFRRAVKLPSTN